MTKYNRENIEKIVKYYRDGYLVIRAIYTRLTENVTEETLDCIRELLTPEELNGYREWLDNTRIPNVGELDVIGEPFSIEYINSLKLAKENI